MDGAAEIYHASPYSPLGNFGKLHDCKMATLFEEQQNHPLYYEFSQNYQMMMRAPSACEDSAYFSDAMLSPHSRIHAYDYQLWPPSGSVYDTVRVDQPNVFSKCSHQNICFDQYGTLKCRQQNQRQPSRARSRSSDSRRVDSHHNNYLDNGTTNNVSNVVHASVRNRNLSGSIGHEGKVWKGNPSPSTSASCCDFSHVARHHGDYVHGPWQQIPWFLRDSYCPTPALPPSSPLDSGLSSQSVASSPSFETEPAQLRRTPECGSPLPLATLQRSQCSCSTNSFADSNILSPLMRSDSGRSSPWAQSAITRLNALTRSKTANIPHVRSSDSEVPDVSIQDLDQRRYSMSGIYISPKNHKSSRKPAERAIIENGHGDYARKNYGGIVDRSSSYGYEYIDDGDTISSRKSRHFKRLQMDTMSPIKRANICGLNSPTQDTDKSPDPESSVSLPVSNSPTELSSPACHKSERVIQKSSKKVSKYNEKALCELEDMYKKLNLQDSDLLDRAERRDLPTEHQLPRLTNGRNASTLTRSKSDSFYEILGPEFCTPYRKSHRAPPMRRAGIPDVVADDMAIRKWRKSFKPHQINTNSASYMLFSSHFTPSIAVQNDVLFENRPDIDYDDLSYRRFFHTGTNKTEDPQPPFGIPLKPLPPQSIFSDYLHVVPSSFPQPLCHPRGNPDLVRDDLAFRTLRKDDRERAMYDSYSLYYRKLR